MPELTQKCPVVSHKLMFLKLKPDINLSEGEKYLNPRKMKLRWHAASKSAEAFNYAGIIRAPAKSQGGCQVPYTRLHPTNSRRQSCPRRSVRTHSHRVRPREKVTGPNHELLTLHMDGSTNLRQKTVVGECPYRLCLHFFLSLSLSNYSSTA